MPPLTGKVKEINSKLEPFDFSNYKISKEILAELKNYPKGGPFEFFNCSVYCGQWFNGKRNGKGV